VTRQEAFTSLRWQTDLVDTLHEALSADCAAAPPHDVDLADGYAVQDAWAAHRITAGEEPVGYKIGLTTPEARTPWRTDEPGRGVLFASSLFPSPAQIRRGDLPLAFEVELAVELGEPVTEDDDVTTLLPKIRAAGPAFELVSSRWEGGAPNIGAWAADNGMASAAVTALVPGATIPERLDAKSIATTDEEQHIYAGNRTRTAALESVLWLARQQPRHPAVTLPAGTLILTGSIIGPVPLDERTARLAATLDGFDGIDLTVER
jgi:2-keto-4-pentenoate hydratase